MVTKNYTKHHNFHAQNWMRPNFTNWLNAFSQRHSNYIHPNSKELIRLSDFNFVGNMQNESEGRLTDGFNSLALVTNSYLLFLFVVVFYSIARKREKKWSLLYE
ncbi:hypothetical protein TNIN_47281 [Trichonephila inaurata madagascariensis]|uniref:Uncharacterized protein n=1 Tax=Trichonephila inaurata madagascariensis TaxID=2747483 RepID=A0A8X7CLM3_9ARAC|nr:hypothetical protein TNIN_47281 [Trichonephila inaurata madagascariensis]